jgi:hypothetical protein
VARKRRQSSVRGIVLVLLLGCFFCISPRASEAFSSLSSCDLIAFQVDRAEQKVPMQSSWQGYLNELASILQRGRQERQPDHALAEQIVAAQDKILFEIPAADRRRYLASPKCAVLVQLNPEALDLVGDRTAIEARFVAYAEQLKSLAIASLRDLDDKQSRGRFRGLADQNLFRAGYYCFVASLVYSVSRPGASSPGLRRYGSTDVCSALRRIE